MALELSHKTWRLVFSDGQGKERQVSIEARNVMRLGEEIWKAKEKFGLPEEVQVRSCYEAGRDGFWLHRYLVSRGIENVVLESVSIEVDRRARRAKTDRLDGGKLLRQLVRHHRDGEFLRIVRVPSVEHEDERRPTSGGLILFLVPSLCTPGTPDWAGGIAEQEAVYGEPAYGRTRGLSAPLGK